MIQKSRQGVYWPVIQRVNTREEKDVNNNLCFGKGGKNPI